ncbi:hypothetical protein IQ265_09165 [Nodosilinea sp. LEGE 06152]|uniref:hypothetical protein n=1 Tax=Nodosilinea sp. LEGE 06152 TaxID=2777966 RepID=UPI001880B26F|nr:hypothetical protein [Nodosilinea sp. LEGE 06152]MBE9156992.1 hypothetical protein [Nodosilinea sp. LEGE 06152]
MDNLILLCDKHHKMAHSRVIDRKALREYKKLLSVSYNTLINERFDQLEKLLREQSKSRLDPELPEKQYISFDLEKRSPKRHEILYFSLDHIAICHYERLSGLEFEHQVEFFRGEDKLLLDALRQSDQEEDIIIDVHYFRTSYIDAPAYASWLEKKIELYELLTGRKARGILLIVVRKPHMKREGYLSLTEQGVKACTRNITLKVYSCEEVGFQPDP